MHSHSTIHRHLSLAPFWIGVIVPALLLTTIVRADDEILKQWETQKSLSEKFFRQMPVLGDRRVEDLFHFQVESRLLVFTSPAAGTPGDQQMRVQVDGIPGTGYVAIQRDPITKELQRFELSITDFPQPNRASTLQIRCEMDKGRLYINQTSEIDGGHQQTMLQQERLSDGNSSPSVLVSIITSSPDGRTSQQLDYTAPDFVTMLREHPEQANQFLRPLFRRIEHEQVFSPDPLTAWQVFSDTRGPDPNVVRRLNDLLPRLNDPSYRVRRAALADLKRIPQPGGADAVNHLNRSNLTPEQNVMLDLYLGPLKSIPEAEVARLRTDPTFLLDCLYTDDVQVRRAALNRLRTQFHPEIDFDLDAPADVRAVAVAGLRKQLTPPRANPEFPIQS